MLYGRGIDEIIARGIKDVGGYFYFPDRNGNISVVTDGTTLIRESYRYDAFGWPSVYDGGNNPLPGGTAINNKFLFTGREWNPTFGFYEYRARAYNPTIGRFMSEDPKGFDAGDYNLYRYCGNDPLDKTDPMGLLDFAFDPSYPKSGYDTFNNTVTVLRSTQRGKQLLDADPGRIIKIAPTDAKHPTSGSREANIIRLDPKDPSFLDPKSRQDFKKYPNELPPSDVKGRAVTVGHELGHVVTGERDENHRGGHNVDKNENPIRHDLKLPDRETYSGVPIRQKVGE